MKTSSRIHAWCLRRRYQLAQGQRVGQLPDFIIIGAQKCGTTAVARALRRHPLVCLATDNSHKPDKATSEMHFFDRDEKWARGIEWYKSQFSGVCAGEDTPNIIYHRQAIQRMHETVPQARLIVALRNPVNRLYSNYMMARQRRYDSPNSWTDRSFEDWLAIGMDFVETGRRPESKADLKAALAVDRGLYDDKLQRVLEHYPRKRIHIIIAERFMRSIDSEVARVHRFLRLPRVALKDAENLRSTNPYAKMSPSTREHLLDFYREANEKLFETLGYRVDEWMQ